MNLTDIHKPGYLKTTMQWMGCNISRTNGYSEVNAGTKTLVTSPPVKTASKWTEWRPADNPDDPWLMSVCLEPSDIVSPFHVGWWTFHSGKNYTAVFAMIVHSLQRCVILSARCLCPIVIVSLQQSNRKLSYSLRDDYLTLDVGS